MEFLTFPFALGSNHCYQFCLYLKFLCFTRWGKHASILLLKNITLLNAIYLDGSVFWHPLNSAPELRASLASRYLALIGSSARLLAGGWGREFGVLITRPLRRGRGALQWGHWEAAAERSDCPMTVSTPTQGRSQAACASPGTPTHKSRAACLCGRLPHVCPGVCIHAGPRVLPALAFRSVPLTFPCVFLHVALDLRPASTWARTARRRTPSPRPSLTAGACSRWAGPPGTT